MYQQLFVCADLSCRVSITTNPHVSDGQGSEKSTLPDPESETLIASIEGHAVALDGNLGPRNLADLAAHLRSNTDPNSPGWILVEEPDLVAVYGGWELFGDRQTIYWLESTDGGVFAELSVAGTCLAGESRGV